MVERETYRQKEYRSPCLCARRTIPTCRRCMVGRVGLEKYQNLADLWIRTHIRR
jgi:hypothetical protein